MGNSKVGFGGSTFSFMWTEGALGAMRKMRAIGLNDFDIIMVPGHFWHDELSPADRARLAGQLAGEGLRIESLNLPALDHNLASCVPEARAYAVGLFTRVMEFAAELGARGVVAVPGRVSSLFPPPREQTEALLADSFGQLLPVAERLGQTIFVELHPQTPVPTTALLAPFMERIDHPLLKVAYDVSNAEFVREDQVESLRRLAPWLGQVHLSDGTATRWRHDRVGMGSVRFGEILQVLDEIGFDGARGLEIISTTPLEDMAASQRALAEMAAG
ncbi:sugar phosphate isomerase/epimerase family protein [Azospirillum endophyticum]